MREIAVSLENIGQSITEIENLRDGLDGAVDRSLDKVADDAAEYAKMQVTAFGKVDSGELRNSITHYESGWHAQTVIATSYHADFVEYGTGIVGMGRPHPDLDTEWHYDINSHGNKGWDYTGADGKKHWTKGQPSSPYMYNTYLYLLKNGQKLFDEAMKNELELSV